ncbi:excinuclease ABC subunit UvrA [uncultured Gimesia sp.]|uniref:excinuclease ABC subunit UvrA n=1 Tax=uncultured Gimesia sp. TaxID=1678688 RepID=UPI0030DD4302|tara:strand:+ start:158292 stop:160913 length:2622 start_codon:yes stop_codon:yes gene_type:complete
MTNQLPNGSPSSQQTPAIQLRGVRVHNLQNINLDIPLNQLTVICGVSGSGKTSLAFDTLYAEGQRRYIETLSTSARQYLNQLPKPDADHVSHIPPAIALKQNAGKRHTGSRGIEPTVAIESGIHHYLRLLYTSLGQVVCPACQSPVTSQTPESVLEFLKSLPENRRYQICYPILQRDEQSSKEIIEDLIQQGMTRVIANHQTYKLTDNSSLDFNHRGEPFLVVIDRLSTKNLEEQRILDSLELVFESSPGQSVILVEQKPDIELSTAPLTIDEKPWLRFDFSAELVCSHCHKEFSFPEPQLFNYFSPTGACPTCQGSGVTSNSSTPVKAIQTCADCHGSRLNEAALAIQVQNRNIDQLCQQSILQLRNWFSESELHLNQPIQQHVTPLLREINNRLALLHELGISYLALNRSMQTLSSGEAQRIALTSTLSSNLVNTLYVLDEPSSGLHSAENHRVISVLQKLCHLNNTLVIVEHEPDFIHAADHIIELGPGAGKAGGQLVFEGSYDQLISSSSSPTGKFLNAPALSPLKTVPRKIEPNWIELSGVTHNNLNNIDVSFPLEQLCVITGISGSGKSSLIEQTLFPVLSDLLTQPKTANSFSFCESVTGIAQIDEVIFLDQSLIGQTPRSIPATYLNLFDDIRTVFAQTGDAKLRNLSPKHFSFNSKNGGRCPECKGTGSIEIDLQFLSNLNMTCPECHGKRYQRELLEIKYRKLNIAEVLELSVDEAFPFFRGQPALQKKLKQLKDVGLGYIPLGQPIPSLSGGECQRLKLAAYLTTSSRNKTLFLMNEPTAGLHPLDIQYVLNCFEYLLTAGHSIIVIEHNLEIIRAADHIIDLGPEAGEAGGSIVTTGTPAEIAQHPTSYTGAALKKLIAAS